MRRVIVVFVTFIMCSVLCSCGNKTDIESSKIELTTENWNDYFEIIIKRVEVTYGEQ